MILLLQWQGVQRLSQRSARGNLRIKKSSCFDGMNAGKDLASLCQPSQKDHMSGQRAEVAPPGQLWRVCNVDIVCTWLHSTQQFPSCWNNKIVLGAVKSARKPYVTGSYVAVHNVLYNVAKALGYHKTRTDGRIVLLEKQVVLERETARRARFG